MAATLIKPVQKASALPEVSRPSFTGLQVKIRQERSSESRTFGLDVSFAVENGITVLFGASGAGKTTLLDAIAGLQNPAAGRISLHNRVLFDSECQVNLPPGRRGVGYVFQDLALFPHLSVEANVEYGLRSLKAAERNARVAKMLDVLGISELRERRPADLSGGERQRVALARALVTEPSLLLLDEPLAALDLPVKVKIADDLRRSIRGMPIPVLYVTHSRDEVFMLGEKMIVLECGRIIAQGTPHQVMNIPRSETVAQLAGFENIFDAEVTAIHEDRGTMTCGVGSLRFQAGQVELETPLIQTKLGAKMRVGISAGDILLATAAPVGLSARNILRGHLLSLSQRDVVVIARVDCGVEMAVHLTLAARDSLELRPGRQVWLIVKTHSCHLLAE